MGIHVRGNEITITGESSDRERVGRLFEELVVLVESGHQLDEEALGRSIEMMRSDQKPTEILRTEVLRGRKTVRPKTAGQKRYVDAVRNNTITFGIGPAGSGKTYLAMAKAIQSLQAKQVNRIILTRPAVEAVALAVQALLDKEVTRIVLTRPAVEAGERLGFLPGDILAKVDPYLRPLYDALYDMLDHETVARLIDRGTLEVAPLAFMRGRTLNDAFIILDEAQNATPEQLKMFLTRIGFGSRLVVTGDVTQIDLLDGRGRSGLVATREILQSVDDIAFIDLEVSDVVRHRIVRDIVAAYEKADAQASKLSASSQEANE